VRLAAIKGRVHHVCPVIAGGRPPQGKKREVEVAEIERVVLGEEDHSNNSPQVKQQEDHKHHIAVQQAG